MLASYSLTTFWNKGIMTKYWGYPGSGVPGVIGSVRQ
jgi:hypothetical protein